MYTCIYIESIRHSLYDSQASTHALKTTVSHHARYMLSCRNKMITEIRSKIIQNTYVSRPCYCTFNLQVRTYLGATLPTRTACGYFECDLNAVQCSLSGSEVWICTPGNHSTQQFSLNVQITRCLLSGKWRNHKKLGEGGRKVYIIHTGKDKKLKG